MRFSRLKISVLTLATMIAAPPVLRAEAKKEEEGAAASGAISKDQKEFNEKTAKLTSLGNRIEETEKKFHEIVKHKAEAKTNPEKQGYIKEMVELAKQRNKDVEMYNKIKAELTYRYPYQGEKLERRYQTQSKRSVEQLETAGGLDELLTRTKKMIDKKFAPFAEKEKEAEAQPKVAQPAEEKPPRLRLEK